MLCVILRLNTHMHTYTHTLEGIQTPKSNIEACPSQNKEMQPCQSQTQETLQATQVSWSSLSVLLLFYLITNSMTQTPCLKPPERLLNRGDAELQKPLSWHLHVGHIKDTEVITVCEHWRTEREGIIVGGGCCFSSLLKGALEKSLTLGWSQAGLKIAANYQHMCSGSNISDRRLLFAFSARSHVTAASFSLTKV